MYSSFTREASHHYLFNYKTNTDNLVITCKGQSLGLVTTYKYLGTDITHDLNMDEYVNSVYKKAGYKVHMFSKIRKNITKMAAIQIYKQTILPYLDYASFLMDSAHQYSLALLDKIQKRSLRLIEYEKDYSKREDHKVLMERYGIQNIRQRRKQQLLPFMYNESLIPSNLNFKSTSLILRSNNKVKFKEKLTMKTSVQNSPITEELHYEMNCPILYKSKITYLNLRKRLNQYQLKS